MSGAVSSRDLLPSFSKRASTQERSPSKQSLGPGCLAEVPRGLWLCPKQVRCVGYSSKPGPGPGPDSQPHHFTLGSAGMLTRCCLDVSTGTTAQRPVLTLSRGCLVQLLKRLQSGFLLVWILFGPCLLQGESKQVCNAGLRIQLSNGRLEVQMHSLWTWLTAIC